MCGLLFDFSKQTDITKYDFELNIIKLMQCYKQTLVYSFAKLHIIESMIFLISPSATHPWRVSRVLMFSRGEERWICLMSWGRPKPSLAIKSEMYNILCPVPLPSSIELHSTLDTFFHWKSYVFHLGITQIIHNSNDLR